MKYKLKRKRHDTSFAMHAFAVHVNKKCIYIYFFLHIRTHIFIYMRVHIHIHTHIYMHIYIYIHTNTHIYIDFLFVISGKLLG